MGSLVLRPLHTNLTDDVKPDRSDRSVVSFLPDAVKKVCMHTGPTADLSVRSVLWPKKTKAVNDGISL